MIRLLGIETSCDETAVSILEVESRKSKVVKLQVRKHLVSSQVPIHRKYGGVVPEVAARSHVAEIVALLSEALGIDPDRASGGGTARRAPTDAFDAIAVTTGPGLATALRVGIEAGRVLAMLSGKPIVGVNHLEGHLASAWLNADNRKAWAYPMLALVVSGGHTELVLMKDACKYRIVGQTRDDAAGEAFDKTAKLMGLPYPGGPEIAKLALEGDPAGFDLPRPMMDDGSFDFSFSGLKTAVRLAWEPWTKGPETLREKAKRDLAASLQQAIVDVLVKKTIEAAEKFKAKGVLLVGGVSANTLLRDTLGSRIKDQGSDIAYLPSDKMYITDNAAMIAAAGYWRLAKGEQHDWRKLEAKPEWNL
ncbi:tRNA (adenosine(37)-N6)-threonylcarbamoyltransferase complex transferase subunit TsaD [Candidatus Uhrbacteria bacterium]|nr:MAG: tRNA (adenosine(37)-N6)-threonylcarbamoyltransferase complex transferase subunit TsaD [Candidatus Uhrbacteria bacterium]